MSMQDLIGVPLPQTYHFSELPVVLLSWSGASKSRWIKMPQVRAELAQEDAIKQEGIIYHPIFVTLQASPLAKTLRYRGPFGGP